MRRLEGKVRKNLRAFDDLHLEEMWEDEPMGAISENCVLYTYCVSGILLNTFMY